MKFEHLVEVNDILNPLADTLNREQLWNGLVLRAESPKLFMQHLDDASISERSATSMRRLLRYGELSIVDTVTLVPRESVTFTIPAQGEILASSLVVKIEESPDGQLFVRFTYDDGADPATDAANEMYNDFKRSAYVEADIDTIRTIRQICAQEPGSGPLN